MSSPLLRSFGHALRGLRLAWRGQRNFRIHLGMALLVIVAGTLVHLSRLEWIAITFAITIVVTLEVLNTIVERFIDVLSPRYSAHVQVIKDLTAGAVLLAAIGAAVVGLLLFLPHLFPSLRIVLE